MSAQRHLTSTPLPCALGAMIVSMLSTSWYPLKNESSCTLPSISLQSAMVLWHPNKVARGHRTYLRTRQSLGEKHRTNDMYNRAFTVAHRQLRAYDDMYGTDFAQRAQSAWEGPDSLNGKSTSDLIPFATTKLYFGRSFPLRILDDSTPAQFASYTLIIWVCPCMIWLRFFATPLVFSVVDSVFCGYVPTNAKATVNHTVWLTMMVSALICK